MSTKLPAPSAAERSRMIATVRSLEPDAHIDVHDDGWNFTVIVAGSSRAYRFPKLPEIERFVEAEVAFLHRFRTTCPLEIPQPELHNGYAVYDFIEGSPLLAEDLTTWSPTERAEAARTLASFLNALHAFSIDELRMLGVDRGGWENWWMSAVDRLQTDVRAVLSDEQRRLADRILAATAPDAVEPPRITVVHNDLGPEHILHRERRIVGIIDFGDVGAGDPALDFQWERPYGEEFLAQVYEHYVYPRDEAFDRRRRLYRAYHTLTHIRDHLLGGDPAGVPAIAEEFEHVARIALEG